MRIHQGWLLHQLHQRRQGLRGDDPGLLQLPQHVLRERMLLLHLLQQHADLLRYQRVIDASRHLSDRAASRSIEKEKPRAVGGQAVNQTGAFLFNHKFSISKQSSYRCVSVDVEVRCAWADRLPLACNCIANCLA